MEKNENKLKSGFVAILGRPNVGKSSIMNRMVGEKVAIVSDKAQTTRQKALGICHRGDTQIVFVDTPGIHKPRTRLGEFMVREAEDAKDGVDAIMVVVDAGFIGKGDIEIMNRVKDEKCPRFLVINKTDAVTPEKLMPRLKELDVSMFDQVVGRQLSHIFILYHCLFYCVLYYIVLYRVVFSFCSVVGNPANAGEVGSVPGSGRSPGEGNGNPLQYTCLGNLMDRRACWGYSPWVCKRVDKT